MLKLSSKAIQIPPNRQRSEFDDAKTQELVASLKRPAGLMHAIVVRSLGKAGFQLVAGERRLRAIEILRFTGGKLRFDGEEVGEDLIPVVTLGELDSIAAKEAELDENIRRVDLTWQERAAATAGLAALRQQQLGVAEATGDFSTILAAEKRADVAAIAQEIRGSSAGVHREATRRELIVAKHLDNPAVKGAKSVDEAFKVLKREEDVKKNVELAASVGRTFTADVHKAENCDSIKWMADYKGELFDAILTDPPYGIGADQFGDSGGKAAGAHTYDDSYESWQKLMPLFAKESNRVTKPQAHLYAFCDIDRFHELKKYLEDEGWNCFRTPLVWHKTTGSRTPWVDFGPQRKYEICIYANKGRKPVTKIFPDVAVYAADENLGHTAQKPVALFTDFLKRSVAPGNLVLDPFAGSGPIFPAAHELKCRAVGIEEQARHYALCLKRLEALKAQKELPLESTKTMLGDLLK